MNSNSYCVHPDWSSAEAPSQLVLAGGQGNGIPGITEFCAPRPGSKKLHVCLLLKCSFEYLCNL